MRLEYQVELPLNVLHITNSLCDWRARAEAALFRKALKQVFYIFTCSIISLPAMGIAKFSVLFNKGSSACNGSLRSRPVDCSALFYNKVGLS